MRSNLVWIGLWVVALIILPLFILNCDDENILQNIGKETWFQFGMIDDTTGSEDFIAVTTDDEIITLAREQLLLSVSERTCHIHGIVTYGNGGHNLDWQWHFLPSEWQLPEMSVEVCDTNPRAVRAWLESMPDTITSILICPLSSYVKAEVQ